MKCVVEKEYISYSLFKINLLIIVVVVTQFLTDLFINKIFGKSKNSEKQQKSKKNMFLIYLQCF